MNTKEIIEELERFKKRLAGEVLDAYNARDSSFGNERFSAWKKRFAKFLDENLPGESVKINEKLTHTAFAVRSSESDADFFWRVYGNDAASFIDSLIIDIRNGEYEPETNPTAAQGPAAKSEEKNTAVKNRVFIVHGHDELTKVETARFIEKLGFEAIILHEQVSKGKTIIEKIETYTDVGFAIVIYTPDDLGIIQEKASRDERKPRARQNVVFEHGYLMAKIGRDRVVPLVKGELELPSDISGVVYITDNNWKINIAKEMKSVGYNIDLNII